MKYKDMISIIIGGAGGVVSSIIGDITPQMISLLILMLIDMSSGFISAFIFQKSTKTECGGLSSKVMLKGICKKVGMLMLIMLAYQLDLTLDINYIKYVTVIALIIEESLSILENLGSCGVPIPNIIKNGIEILNKQMEDLEK